MELQGVHADGEKVTNVSKKRALPSDNDIFTFRGFDHDKIRPELRASRPIVSRIFLPSSVYLDMLNLAYFAIYNNFGVRN